MRSVVIISSNIVNCESATFYVKSRLSVIELNQILQSVSPRFEITTRPYDSNIDGLPFVDLDEAIYLVKTAVLTYVDPYNYAEVETWHIVEDGVFTYEKFRNCKYKVVDGKLYRMKKEFQRCPLKHTLRNISDGSWRTCGKL